MEDDWSSSFVQEARSKAIISLDLSMIASWVVGEVFLKFAWLRVCKDEE